MFSKYLALPAALALTACGGATTLPIVYAVDDTILDEVAANGTISLGASAPEIFFKGDEIDYTVSTRRSDIIVTITPTGEDTVEVSVNYRGEDFTGDGELFLNADENRGIVVLDELSGDFGTVLQYDMATESGDEFAYGFIALGLQTQPENMPSGIEAGYSGGGLYAATVLGDNPDEIVREGAISVLANTDFEDIAFLLTLVEFGDVVFEADITGSNFSGQAVSTNLGTLTTSDLQGFFLGPNAEELIGDFVLQYEAVDVTVGVVGAFGASESVEP